MELAIMLAVAAGVPVGWVLVSLIRRMSGKPDSLPVTAEWIDELSVERYRPLLRLLNNEDLRYLVENEGYTRRQAFAFRARRCEIIRGYLRWLESDFARICMAIRLLMVQSHQDRPDLAAVLIQRKVAFHLGMIGLQAHLTVYRWGLTRMDVNPVMAAFDSLRIELQHMVPVAAGAHR